MVQFPELLTDLTLNMYLVKFSVFGHGEGLLNIDTQLFQTYVFCNITTISKWQNISQLIVLADKLTSYFINIILVHKQFKMIE